MNTWWLLLMSRSRRDSATTGLGNSGYQSAGARLDVRISDFPALSVMSSYRSSAWAAVSSRMAKSSRSRTAGRGCPGEPPVPGPVGVPAGEGGRGPAGLHEPCLGAGPDREVGEGLGDVALADPDGSVEDDRLARLQPAGGGEGGDRGGGG